MTMDLSLLPIADTDAVIRTTMNAVNSLNTRRAYTRWIREFLQFANGAGCSRTTVLAYRQSLVGAGRSPKTVNQALSAINAFVREAHAQGAVDEAALLSITSVKGMPIRGRSIGRWLTTEQIGRLFALPDRTTNGGRRDFVLLGLLAGCGLRREEVCRITCEMIQLKDCKRWVIADLVGKGLRKRTIPIAPWLHEAIVDWMTCEQGPISGPLIRRLERGDVVGPPLTNDGVAKIVGEYSRKLGYRFTAHDLRRSFAKLAHKGGAKLDQIQLALGHSSIQTTEIYLGVELDLDQPACDFIVGGKGLGGKG